MNYTDLSPEILSAHLYPNIAPGTASSIMAVNRSSNTSYFRYLEEKSQELGIGIAKSIGFKMIQKCIQLSDRGFSKDQIQRLSTGKKLPENLMIVNATLKLDTLLQNSGFFKALPENCLTYNYREHYYDFLTSFSKDAKVGAVPFYELLYKIRSIPDEYYIDISRPNIDFMGGKKNIWAIRISKSSSPDDCIEIFFAIVNCRMSNPQVDNHVDPFDINFFGSITPNNIYSNYNTTLFQKDNYYLNFGVSFSTEENEEDKEECDEELGYDKCICIGEFGQDAVACSEGIQILALLDNTILQKSMGKEEEIKIVRYHEGEITWTFIGEIRSMEKEGLIKPYFKIGKLTTFSKERGFLIRREYSGTFDADYNAISPLSQFHYNCYDKCLGEFLSKEVKTRSLFSDPAYKKSAILGAPFSLL